MKEGLAAVAGLEAPGSARTLASFEIQVECQTADIEVIGLG
jgi:hypothetical protein